MKNANHLSSVILLCFFFCWTAVGGETNLIKKFKADYKAAKTDDGRKTVCLEAIDQGVIVKGEPLTNVKEIFGGDFTDYGQKDSNGISYGIVDFSKVIKGRPDTSDFYVGWYMVVYYDSGGYIYKYRLSNLHK